LWNCSDRRGFGDLLSCRRLLLFGNWINTRLRISSRTVARKLGLDSLIEPEIDHPVVVIAVIWLRRIVDVVHLNHGHVREVRDSLPRDLVQTLAALLVRADKIVVLYEGKIVEQGRHEELLERRGMYYELVQKQLNSA